MDTQACYGNVNIRRKGNKDKKPDSDNMWNGYT